MPFSRFLLVIFIAFQLSACSQIQEDLALQFPKKAEKMKYTFDNGADLSHPLLQPMGYPIPDRSYDREGASERQPWNLLTQRTFSNENKKENLSNRHINPHQNKLNFERMRTK